MSGDSVRAATHRHGRGGADSVEVAAAEAALAGKRITEEAAMAAADAAVPERSR